MDAFQKERGDGETERQRQGDPRTRKTIITAGERQWQEEQVPISGPYSAPERPPTQK